MKFKVGKHTYTFWSVRYPRDEFNDLIAEHLPSEVILKVIMAKGVEQALAFSITEGENYIADGLVHHKGNKYSLQLVRCAGSEDSCLDRHPSIFVFEAGNSICPIFHKRMDKEAKRLAINVLAALSYDAWRGTINGLED